MLANKRMVIFGCGYVGGALADEAVGQGATVTALTRNAHKAAALAARGLQVVVGELESSDWHAQIEPEAEIVVNTVSAAESTPAGYRRSYVEGMQSILAWAKTGARPVGTLLYTSSTGVYPQGNGAVVDEMASTESAGETGSILVEAEDLLRGAAKQAVSRWFILRLAGIYGPGRHHLLNALRGGATQFPGDPAFRLNLIHRDDIVSALLGCAQAPQAVANEIFNLSDNAPGTREEVVSWLATALGMPAPQFSGVVAPSSRRGGAGVPDRSIRSDKIRQALGWSPRYADFCDGYRQILGQEGARAGKPSSEL